MRKTSYVLSLFALSTMVQPVWFWAQDTCPEPTRNTATICLETNVTTTTSVPPAFTVLNTDHVTFTIQNVSPLETCKLTGSSFTATAPSSALQQAVTSFATFAPFGVAAATVAGAVTPSQTSQQSKNLYSNIQKGSDLLKALGLTPSEPDPLQRIKGEFKTLVDDAETLGALQADRQNDNIALTNMYAAFIGTDYRGRVGDFGRDFKKLTKSFARVDAAIIPGEQPSDAQSRNDSRPDNSCTDEKPIPLSGNQNGRLVSPNKRLFPEYQQTFPKCYGSTPRLVDLQADLDAIKNEAADAHKQAEDTEKTLPDEQKITLNQALVALDEEQSIATQILAQLTANDTALKSQQAALLPLKVNLGKLFAQLGSYNPKARVDLTAPIAKDGTLSGNITCVNRVDNSKVTLDPVPYSVVYQSVPLLSLSTGVAFSGLSKVTYGVQTVKTGVDASGVDTTANEVAITDSSKFQVVPFAYLTLRIHHWRYFDSSYIGAVGATGGFGVNTDAGTKNPDFFTGASLSVDRFFLHFGADFAQTQRLAGGFTLNEQVPDSTTVPVTNKVVRKFMVGISVRVYP